MSDFAARLRNSLASSSENLPQLTKEKNTPPKRKKPTVPPRPALNPSLVVDEEFDDFEDYDSDEWESFSEPESHDNKGIDSDDKVASDKSHYDSPYYSIVSKSPEHSATDRGDCSTNNVYERAEGFEGQTVPQPEISKLSQSVSGISTNKHAGEYTKSNGDRDDIDCYDKPEHVIII